MGVKEGSGCSYKMATGRIVLLMEMVYGIGMAVLVVMLRYSFVRHHHQGETDKGYMRSLSCALYYFL